MDIKPARIEWLQCILFLFEVFLNLRASRIFPNRKLQLCKNLWVNPKYRSQQKNTILPGGTRSVKQEPKEINLHILPPPSEPSQAGVPLDTQYSRYWPANLEHRQTAPHPWTSPNFPPAPVEPPETVALRTTDRDIPHTTFPNSVLRRPRGVIGGREGGKTKGASIVSHLTTALSLRANYFHP